MTFWVAGAVVVGGAISANAAGDAADTQAQSARDATAAQERMFNKQIELQEPWRQGGGLGLNALLYGMGLSQNGTFSPTPAGSAPAQPGVSAPAVAQPVAQQGLSLDTIRQLFDAGMLEPTGAGQPFNNLASGGSVDARLVAQAVQGFSDSGRYPDVVPPAAASTNPLASAVSQPAATTTSPPPGLGYGALLRPFGMSDFQADPGYQFRQQEGEKGLQRARAASGGLGSGAFLKDAMRFNQGLATDEYGRSFDRYRLNQGDTFNRLASLAGIGQTATNQTSAAAGNFGSQIGSNIIGAGNARAAGQVGSANAWNNAISQGTSMYQQNQLMNRAFPSAPDYYNYLGGGSGNYNFGGGL